MTDVEEVLQQVWSAVLESSMPGPADDFFAGGGDSLAAAEMVAGLRQRTGISLDAGWLYAHPRFADAAAALRAAAGTQLTVNAVTACRRVPGRDHPLSAQQEGLLSVLNHIGAQHRYQVAYAVAIPDQVDTGRWGDALAQLGMRHTALRTTIRGDRQVIGAELPGLEVLHVGAPATAREAATRWAAQRIRADADRLVRFAVTRDDTETLLVMAAHQIVTDPWSWGVLLRDLTAFCTSGSCGEAPLQYSDYARWQHAHLDEAGYDVRLRFWRTAAAGIPESGMPLPGAPQRWAPAGPAATVPLQIPLRVVEALRTAAGALQVSLFHLLLALFKTSVARWSGHFDVLVGSATANRQVPGTRDVVGYFVNGRFTRLDVAEFASVADLAVAVRDAWVDGDAHQDLHLEPTLFALGTPDLVNVKFSVNTVRTLHPLPRLGGIPLRPVPVTATGSARRHVSVALTPHAGGISGGLTYRTDVLARGSAEALASTFDQLLQQTAAGGTSHRLR